MQENGDERISADDKDFPTSFNLMIDLTTRMVNEWEAKYSGMNPERSSEYLIKVDTLRERYSEEAFLDPVFGINSTLLRAEWESQVLAHASWIFNSNTWRIQIDNWLRKQ